MKNVSFIFTLKPKELFWPTQYYSKYLIQVELYHICPFVTGLFHLA